MWWGNQKWNGLNKPSDPRTRLLAYPREFVPCKPFSWMDWALPSESQNGPSCAGHAMANFKEIMLRRYHPEGHGVFRDGIEIDGDAIWFRARKMFYAGRLNGGLYIPQAFEAAVDMGIFAPGSRLLTVDRHEAMYSEQFERTPFIDGRDVSGWQAYNTMPNGQVYEASEMMDGTGGHATLDVSRLTQDGRNYWQSQNSWGTKFGWCGTFILSAEEDDREGLEDVKYYIVEPDGWEQNEVFRKYEWRMW